MRSEASLARAVSFPRVINVDDLRRLARRRLPAVVFAYIDGGAEDEVTLRENVDAFREITFRPRQCVAVPKCDLRTTVLGTELAVPFMLAPVGFCRMFYPRGEVVAAREAGTAGTGYILSTFSGTRLEEVRQGTNGPLWYQLYVPGGRAVAEAAIARAKAAGYTALVVTIDTPVAGMRERDFRHGVRHLLQGKFWASVPHSGQFITRPRWVMDFLADGAPRVFPNVELPGVGPMPCGDVGALLEQTLVTWDEDAVVVLLQRHGRQLMVRVAEGQGGSRGLQARQQVNALGFRPNPPPEITKGHKERAIRSAVKYLTSANILTKRPSPAAFPDIGISTDAQSAITLTSCPLIHIAQPIRNLLSLRVKSVNSGLGMLHVSVIASWSFAF
jgi:hypothetical protein